MGTYSFIINQNQALDAATIFKYRKQIIVAVLLLIIFPLIVGLAIRPGMYVVEAVPGVLVMLVFFIIKQQKFIKKIKRINRVDWNKTHISFFSDDKAIYSTIIEDHDLIRKNENMVYLHVYVSGRKLKPEEVVIAINEQPGNEILPFIKRIFRLQD